MRCEFSPQAIADLREIGDFISRDNPERARSFVLELLDHAHRLADHPEAYPSRPELGQELRACVQQRSRTVRGSSSVIAPSPSSAG
jgi:toxin ParE1/3/4